VLHAPPFSLPLILITLILFGESYDRHVSIVHGKICKFQGGEVVVISTVE
jgi:hypothetical protein